MNWESSVRSAETLLGSSRVPPAEEIIGLIKQVNPTSLSLPEPDRERGYQVKNELQNLLLENYGETFHLAPHPYDPQIILIKHNTLPSVDACHTNIARLSMKALDTVCGELPAPAAQRAAKRSGKEKAKLECHDNASPKEALRAARRLLDEYDYPQAETLLAGIRIRDGNDLPTLLSAVRTLREEMGAYERALSTLLAQPRQFLKDKAVRELLALTYYGNGMMPEARVVFAAAHPADLGKEALLAWADIAFKDGNLLFAYKLVRLSEEKEGFVTFHAELRKKIEDCLQAEAEPWLQRAEAALQGGDLEEAQDLAREALAHYPGWQKARHILSVVDSIKIEKETESLWAQLEQTEGASARLELLDRLLTSDKRNSGKIHALIKAEKAKRQEKMIEDRVGSLQTLAAENRWPECFEILYWLSRLDGDLGQFRDAFGISPYFTLLFQNKKLLRLDEEEAKEIWLNFIGIDSRSSAGATEADFNLLREMKPFFHSFALFKERWEVALTAEQEKARHEFRALLTELETDECSLEQAKGIVARMRKPLALLPAAEGALYRQVAQEQVDLFLTENGEEENLIAYHEALKLGNTAKAASLREAITDQEAARVVEERVAEEFTIIAEPITLTVSADLEVDLAEEGPLSSHYITDRHAVYNEDDCTLIVVHLRRMTATRFRSPRFKDLGIEDCIPEQDIFLFREEDGTRIWKAKLSESDSRFLATFDFEDHFTFEHGASFVTFFMSCHKDNDYYACIEEGDSYRFVRQSIDTVSTTVRSHYVKGELTFISRLSYQPDVFLLGSDCCTAILNGNLDMVRNCSHAVRSPSEFFFVDIANSHVYVLADCRVLVLNSRFRIINDYPNAYAALHFRFDSIRGLCVETGTVAMAACGAGRLNLYNLHTNKFSQSFCISKLLSVDGLTRWYYLEYDKNRSMLMLRDITEELDKFLEWRIFSAPDNDDEVNEAIMTEFLKDCYRLPAKNKSGEPAA